MTIISRKLIRAVLASAVVIGLGTTTLLSASPAVAATGDVPSAFAIISAGRDHTLALDYAATALVALGVYGLRRRVTAKL